jgi:hypothetical protein
MSTNTTLILSDLNSPFLVNLYHFRALSVFEKEVYRIMFVGILSDDFTNRIQGIVL